MSELNDLIEFWCGNSPSSLLYCQSVPTLHINTISFIISMHEGIWIETGSVNERAS